jgi:hypothetical protein
MPGRESVSGICFFAANWREVFWKDDHWQIPALPMKLSSFPRPCGSKRMEG